MIARALEIKMIFYLSRASMSGLPFRTFIVEYGMVVLFLVLPPWSIELSRFNRTPERRWYKSIARFTVIWAIIVFRILSN